MSVHVRRCPVAVDYASALKCGLEGNLPSLQPPSHLSSTLEQQQRQVYYEQMQQEEVKPQQQQQLRQNQLLPSSSSSPPTLSLKARTSNGKGKGKGGPSSSTSSAAIARKISSSSSNNSNSNNNKKKKRSGNKKKQQNNKNKNKADIAKMTKDAVSASASSGSSMATNVTTTAMATMMQMTSATATGPVSDIASNAAGQIYHDAEMRSTPRMKTTGGGRCGTPDGNIMEHEDEPEHQHRVQLEAHQQQQQRQETEMLFEGTDTASVDVAQWNSPARMMLLEDEISTPLSKFLHKVHHMPMDELGDLLKEYSHLQDKYHTILTLPKEDKCVDDNKQQSPPREITEEARDGAAHLLRYLKVWYDLPTDVLFVAVCLVDRFLGRMHVKPKHMTCLTVASFYLAVKQMNCTEIPAEHIVNISQAGCTVNDLERMANIIVEKLGVQMSTPPVTSLNFLRIFYVQFRTLAQQIGGDFNAFFNENIKLTELQTQLEVLLCNMKANVLPPAVLALACFSLNLDLHIKPSIILGHPTLKTIFDFILHLQEFLMIPVDLLPSAFTIVSDVLNKYNNQRSCRCEGKVVWRLSSRTMRILRPMKGFEMTLPSINETAIYGNDDAANVRNRNDSTSSEEEDWPTSPFMPIKQT